MKKTFALLAAALMSVMGVVSQAEVITPEVAKQTADNYMTLVDEWRGANDAEVRLVEFEGVPAYYVV